MNEDMRRGLCYDDDDVCDDDDAVIIHAIITANISQRQHVSVCMRYLITLS